MTPLAEATMPAVLITLAIFTPVALILLLEWTKIRKGK